MAEDDSGRFINIRDQAALSLAGNLADAAISFAGIVLFANVLGAGGLGKFYLVLAVVKVALFPVKGVGQSVMKRGSERGLDPATFLGSGLVYGTAYVVLVGGLVGAVLVVDASLLQYDADIVLSAFAVFGSRILFLLLLDTYRSHGQTGYATLTDNVLGVLETFLQAALLLAGLGVVGLLAGTVITTVAVSAALLAVTGVEPGRPDLDALRSTWRFARWSVLTSGLGTVYDRLPVLVLGVVLGNAAAGYYTSAMRLLMLGSYVGGSIAPALMVRASATTAAAEDGLADLEMSLQYAAILAIPMMFGSFAIPGALMITIFGPTFASAGPVLAALSLYHVVNTYDTVTYSFFDGIDRPEFSTKSTLLSLVVRVVTMVPLLGQFGVLGVVGAVVVSHAFHLLLAQWLLRSEFGRPVLPTRPARQLLSGLVMWVLVTALAGLVPIRSWLHLLVVVGTGAGCYVGLLVATDGFLRDMGRQLLRERAPTLG